MKLTIGHLRRIIKEELSKENIDQLVKNKSVFTAGKGSKPSLSEIRDTFEECEIIFPTLFKKIMKQEKELYKHLVSTTKIKAKNPQELFEYFTSKPNDSLFRIVSYTGYEGQDEKIRLAQIAVAFIKDNQQKVFWWTPSNKEWSSERGQALAKGRNEALEAFMKDSPPKNKSSEVASSPDKAPEDTSSTDKPSGDVSAPGKPSGSKKEKHKFTMEIASDLKWTDEVDGKQQLRKDVIKSGKAALLQKVLVALQKNGKLTEALKKGILKLHLNEFELRKAGLL
jgi:hypothetical protein